MFHERPSDGGGEMAFPTAGRSEEEEVGALAEREVPGREGHHLGLGEHGDGGELEVGEALAGEQPGVAQMPLDPPAGALGEFVLGQRGEEARRRPALRIRPLAELLPQLLHGGQAQFAQHQAQLDPVHPHGRGGRLGGVLRHEAPGARSA